MSLLYFITLSFTILICNADNFTQINKEIRLFGFETVHSLINQYKVAISDMVQIIKMHGYSVKKHKIITPDGYILFIYQLYKNQLHKRINHEPVLVFSGFGSSPQAFALFKESLLYSLYKQGYDVWLGNLRGTVEDCFHTKYPQWDSRFWDFSFDEMTEYDFPSIIDYVLRTTNRTQLSLITYSLSTVTSVALLASKPEYNKKIKRNVALAPGINARYTTGFSIKLFARFHKQIKIIYNLISAIDFLNFLTVKLSSYFIPFLCITVLRHPCALFVTAGTGYNPYGYGDNFGLIVSSFLKGISFKSVVQMMDIVATDGRPKRYDYGIRENLNEYGTETPPLSNISSVTAPISLFYSAADALASPLNVEMAARELQNVRKELMKPVLFNHLDFAGRIKVLNSVNNKILEHLALPAT